MALTRKMLAAMDIPAEKIDEIINAYSETINEIKSERDQFRADVEELKKKEQEFTIASSELEKFKTGNWEKKYNDLKSEYDSYKDTTVKKEIRSAKEKAYKEILIEAGVSSKRIDSIMRVSKIDDIEIDKDGKVVDADKILEGVKTEWADFIQTTHEKGADVANPPSNNGGDVKKPSRAQELVAKYRNEHYGNPNKED